MIESAVRLLFTQHWCLFYLRASIQPLLAPFEPLPLHELIIIFLNKKWPDQSGQVQLQVME